MRAGTLALWIAVLLLALSSADAEERFTFVIPGDDASPSFTNLAHLSRQAAGKDGFVRIQDGRFVTDSGRLRIWAVNTCFGANFPAHADAEQVAPHLAKLGVNGIPAEIRLPFRAKRVQALDGRGQPKGDVPLSHAGSTTRFSIGPQHQTLWYQVEAAAP